MTFNFNSIETPDISSSSSSEHALFATESSLPLPEFVKRFAQDQEKLDLSRDCLVNMLNTLEKDELIELLSMSVMQSSEVRSSVAYTLSTMTTYRRLLVRNISFGSTTEEVRELLESRYGLIEEGSVVYDRATGKSKGFAFMTFASVESACNAIMDSNNGLIELKGRPVLLKFAADRVDAINTNNRLVSNDSSSTSESLVSSGRRLFVSALAPETNSDSLAIAMAPYGEMEECFVVSHPNGISRRFGFVTFVSENSAWACLQNPVSVDGTIVSIQPAAERNANTGGVGNRPTARPATTAPKVDDLVSSLLTQLNQEASLSSLLSSYQ